MVPSVLAAPTKIRVCTFSGHSVKGGECEKEEILSLSKWCQRKTCRISPEVLLRTVPSSLAGQFPDPHHIVTLFTTGPRRSNTSLARRCTKLWAPGGGEAAALLPRRLLPPRCLAGVCGSSISDEFCSLLHKHFKSTC